MENLTPAARASLTVGITLSVLAGVAVLLRLVAKRLVKSGLAADDWWIVGSVVMMWVAGSILAWGEYDRRSPLDPSLRKQTGLLSRDGRGAQGINRQDPNFRYQEHTEYLKVCSNVALAPQVPC